MLLPSSTSIPLPRRTSYTSFLCNHRSKEYSFLSTNLCHAVRSSSENVSGSVSLY
ncbi:hypothetical protein DSM3645_03203 [Blastopirellula marina DSM 3645]|uniref:Uncharacterized protein n=1 Tax=Blastopirellula marina DSM 3645 TaxID=314230 RepID=A3ZVV4_9BACT|nr:hypothetical protein DSM3645_03203 [Blastopirellula marina DSM 3645]